jgi:hypothetical protein
LITPGGLVAGLAGSVLLCCFSTVQAQTAEGAEMPPVQEKQLVSAFQAAFAESEELADGLVLQLSLELVFPATPGREPLWQARLEEVLPLRLARDMVPVADNPPPIGNLPPPSRVPTPGEPPLRLSQNIGSAAAPRSPRWMTLPELTPQLRSSRTLTMPGVAGIGRPSPAAPIALGGGPATGELAPTAGDDTGEAFAGNTPRPGVAMPGGVPVSAVAAAPVAETADTGLAGTGWEIPPIRWGGNLGYSLQRSSSGSANSNSAQALFANLNASSYIYAPWFATISGRLGITDSSSNSSSQLGSSDSSSSANIVGGGEINMFSSSRFPFRAYFDRSDSRVSGTLVAQDYVNTRFGLTQNFRAEDAMSNGSFMLDHSSVATSDRRNDNVTALSGSYGTQTGLWQHNLNGRYSLGQREGTGERAVLSGFNTSHNANLSDNANLSATVNYSDTDLRTADSAGGLYNSRGRYLQVYTYGSWMPEFEDLDDLPLTLNGSLRYASQQTQFGVATSTAQTMGGNLSALYRHSANLTTSLNTALNQISVSGGNSRLLALVGGNLNYVGNPLTFGKFSYNWNAGTNVNWQSGSGEVPSNTVFGGLVSHSLSRVYTFDSGQNLSLSLSQSLNMTNSQVVGRMQSLSNNLSANYGMGFGERFSGSISGTLSDVYTTGVNEQHYTNFNLGLVGQGQISQQSSLNLNLMFNWSDQTYQTQDSFGFQQSTVTQRMTLNGSLNYSHLRFAGVRGLRYNLLFAADTRLRDERLYGDLNAQQDRSRMSLTNRLDYAVGLLNFRLSFANNDVGGKKNALLFFQVTRQFGSY